MSCCCCRCQGWWICSLVSQTVSRLSSSCFELSPFMKQSRVLLAALATRRLVFADSRRMRLAEAMETKSLFCELFHPIVSDWDRLQNIASLRMMASTADAANVRWLLLLGRVDELFLERRWSHRCCCHLRRFGRGL